MSMTTGAGALRGQPREGRGTSQATKAEGQEPVLDIRTLTVTYDTESGPLHTVRNVSLQIAPGEIYGLVGESGSGKTTLARGIVQYLPANGHATGDMVALDGTNLLGLPRSEMRKIWGSKIT